MTGERAGDSNAFLQMQINGATLFALNDSAAYPYTQYSFTFTESGSDTLTIAAQTNPSKWYVDSIAVSGATTTPEPRYSGC
jgi:hypothetical protein